MRPMRGKTRANPVALAALAAPFGFLIGLIGGALLEVLR